MKYTSHLTQTQPLDETQVLNNAGGFVYRLDPWAQLRRFLILGTEGGSYYCSERKMTQDNAQVVIQCIKEDGARALAMTVSVSTEGRAPKNDPAIFVLALICTHGAQNIKESAYTTITAVCRTGTHLFTFCGMINDLRGWSRGLRRGVGKFYDQPIEKLGYQLVKYRQRNGWTHRDVLRLSHPSIRGLEHQETLKWVVGKSPIERKLTPEIIQLYESVNTPNAEPVPGIIRRLPWEALPTNWLKEKEVWEELLHSMPLMALMRNLNKLSLYAGIDSNLSVNALAVADRFSKEAVLKARLHPLKILEALRTYEAGRGHKGSLKWQPAPIIIQALEAAFYHGFGTIEKTGKAYFVGLDVSGSMTSAMPGSFLSCADAASALLMTIVRTEENCEIIGFDDKPRHLNLTANMSLREVRAIAYNGHFGTTDCSIPMQLAMALRRRVDVFEVITDNETYAGRIHPSVALREYRKLSGVDSKLVVWGMTATGFTIADPNDPGMLDVVGFDTSVPELIRTFIS